MTIPRLPCLLLLLLAAPAGAREEVIRVKATVRSNETYVIPVDAARVTRVEATVRRMDPRRRDTRLELDGAGEAQVDRQELHVLAWTVDAQGDRPLRLTARDGDVHLDSLRVTLAGDAPAAAGPAANTVRLNRTLRADEGVDTGLESADVLRVEARVRRLHRGQQDTRLDLNPGGGVAQVDRQEIHTVTWTPDPGRSRSGSFRIHARGGEVHIESVTVVRRPKR